MRNTFSAYSVATDNEKSTVTDIQLKLGNRNVANFHFEFLRDIYLSCSLSFRRYNLFGGPAECFLLRLSVTDVAVHRKNSSGNVRYLRESLTSRIFPFKPDKGRAKKIPEFFRVFATMPELN